MLVLTLPQQLVNTITHILHTQAQRELITMKVTSVLMEAQLVLLQMQEITLTLFLELQSLQVNLEQMQTYHHTMLFAIL